MSRDRLENALRRVHSDALATTTIDVYEPTESFTQGEGFEVSYPDTADASYEARLEQPDDDTDRERSGTSSEIDAVVRVRDDTGQTWTDFGESGQVPVRLEDTSTGITYEVQSAVDQHDGLVELAVVEI